MTELRARAAHAPFRRAGVYFATARDPVEVPTETLTPAALLALLRDPGVALEVLLDDRTIRPVPSLNALPWPAPFGGLSDLATEGLRFEGEAREEDFGASDDGVEVDPEDVGIALVLAEFGVTTVIALGDAHRALIGRSGDQAAQILRLTDDLRKANDRTVAAEKAAEDAKAAQLKAEDERKAAQAALAAAQPSAPPAKATKTKGSAPAATTQG